MYTNEEINLIILSSFSELSYAFKKILSEQADLKNYENFLIKTLSGGVYNKVNSLFHDEGYRGGILKSLEKKGIKCVTIYSDGYPETLKNISAPPVVLYCKGDVSLLKTNCFSIVGSRRTSQKSLADCKKMAGEISSRFTVVSGFADGADSAALEGALAAGGKVISVFANGLDYIYPAINRPLADKVEKCGLIITEYPPEVGPKPYHFPVRNRIIAGLSKGTLVVSADKTSGALIPADYAADYGRDVFAFPYSIGAFSGAGCNALIKKGAFLAENILDIFGVYSLDFNTPAQTDPLSEDENAVYVAVKSLGDAFLPDVAETLGKPLYEVRSIICALEIKKKVAALGGNRYSAI